MRYSTEQVIKIMKILKRDLRQEKIIFNIYPCNASVRKLYSIIKYRYLYTNSTPLEMWLISHTGLYLYLLLNGVYNIGSLNSQKMKLIQLWCMQIGNFWRNHKTAGDTEYM